MNILLKIPHDKMGHIIAGTLVFLFALLLGVTIWVGMAVVLAAGIGKETYDYFHQKHTSDVWDAVATVSLAWLVGIILLWRLAHG